MTFSIVARDTVAAQLGVAVASKFLAVGAVVPWLESEVGAIATQALANTSYGPEGLALLRAGASAREALDAVVGGDDGGDDRQAGFVDARGGAATHTGARCMDWAGGRTGPGYAVQGNILTGPEVVDAMATAFEASTGELADRLLVALAAGDAAGGDRRGRQSAALAVVAPGGGYGGNDDNLVDLRVDDHTGPVAELRRLYAIHVRLTGTTPEAEKLPLSGALADEVRELLARAGYPGEPGEDGLGSALRAFVGVENLEARWWHEQRLDPVVLAHLRGRADGRT
ncbi:MAG TPA: DUF1028 domain-containing protein [Gaiellales bacterium]|nr:DUF1028 domain-containing protein [Gaiellales bacterium]